MSVNIARQQIREAKGLILQLRAHLLAAEIGRLSRPDTDTTAVEEAWGIRVLRDAQITVDMMKVLGGPSGPEHPHTRSFLHL